MKKLSVEEIRTVVKASPFLGEGPLQVKARLAAKGIRAGKNRVLRLEGWRWFFAAADHRASDVAGWHAAKKGGRRAAQDVGSGQGRRLGQRPRRASDPRRERRNRSAGPGARTPQPGMR